MLVTLPPKYHKGRRIKQQATAAGPAALTLVSASYDDTVTEVYMTFDRAIDASAYNPAAFVLIDGSINSQSYVGNMYDVVLGGVTLRIQLDVTGSASGPDVLLSVSGGNGIVAADDGGVWDGVLDLSLPFP